MKDEKPSWWLQRESKVHEDELAQIWVTIGKSKVRSKN